MAILLSSFLIYNSVGVIDEVAITNLRYLLNIEPSLFYLHLTHYSSNQSSKEHPTLEEPELKCNLRSTLLIFSLISVVAEGFHVRISR